MNEYRFVDRFTALDGLAEKSPRYDGRIAENASFQSIELKPRPRVVTLENFHQRFLINLKTDRRDAAKIVGIEFVQRLSVVFRDRLAARVPRLARPRRHDRAERGQFVAIRDEVFARCADRDQEVEHLETVGRVRGVRVVEPEIAELVVARRARHVA